MRLGVLRWAASATIASTALFASAPALADDRAECASAADQAQQLRDEGKYRRAREHLLVCARDVCPAPIKRDCLDWLNQLESIAPTVVFAAKDGARDLTDVKVSVDGVVVAERLDGKPVPMDLGAHKVKFEYQGQSKEEDVVVGAGQKGRNISVVFGAPPPTGPVTPPPAAESSEGSLVPAFIVGGIGILGLGSFAIFGISGKSDVSDLEKTCKPNCAQSEVDSARTKLIIADISLGVGIVALGVATYMILTRPKIDAGVKAASASGPPRPAKPPTSGIEGLRLDFGPTTGGAVGSIGATF